jgi:hypothetical protein
MIACLLWQVQSQAQSLLSSNPLVQLDLETAYETSTFLHFHRAPTDLVLPLFLAVSPQAHQTAEDEIQIELDDFVTFLKKKQSAYKNDERFLQYMYYKVHNKYLKRYTQYPDFLSLFEAGQYDCVTGTALYAYLLDALGYTYTIQELKYHIYLLVWPRDIQNDSRQACFLIESTDPQYGFVSNRSDIQKRIQWYHNEENPATANANYQYNFQINNTINLVELAGLAYYNSAVAHYNQQHFARAITQLKKAKFLYESQRMEAFMGLIDHTLATMPQSKLTH